jgi:hypothetical protein
MIDEDLTKRGTIGVEARVIIEATQCSYLEGQGE